MADLAVDPQLSETPGSFKKPRKAGNGLQATKTMQGSSTDTRMIKNSLTAEEFSKVIDECYSLDMVKCALDLWGKIQLEAAVLTEESFGRFIMPSLSSFANTLQRQTISIKGPLYAEIYLKIVWLYIHRFLDPEPSPPQNWTREVSICSCQDCQWLNRFLRDPEVRDTVFMSNAGRRSHLQAVLSRLPSRPADCSQTRKGRSYTLSISKNTNEYKQAKKSWTRKKANSESVLNLLGKDVMMVLFGVKSAEELLQLPQFVSAPMENARPPLTPTLQAPNLLSPTAATATESPNQTESTRRGVTIVDLT